jgi:5-methylcytosine-specific restriction protein B
MFSKKLIFEDAIELGLINFITFHQSYSYEEFIEGLKPIIDNEGKLSYEIVNGIFKNICSNAISHPEQNYVLIIDEINRGNISKIFGELITLIESSKRLNQIPKENPQSTLLPYSRIKFSVPNNIYILGTMNSADKSITSIDTALRRRFNFIEVPPSPILLKDINHQNSTISLSNILHTLNERIEYLLDRDHLIGHSYFMNVSNWNDLCQIFHQNIIPTLQDYFFNDWKKVAMVLGDTPGFKKTENENFIIPKNKKYSDLFLDDDDSEDNIQYEINPILISGNYNNFPLEAIQKSFIFNE